MIYLSQQIMDHGDDIDFSLRKIDVISVIHIRRVNKNIKINTNTNNNINNNYISIKK